MTAGGILIIIMNQFLGFLPVSVVEGVSQLIMMYVGAQGVADLGAYFGGKK